MTMHTDTTSPLQIQSRQPQALTHDDIRRLPVPERKLWIERIRVQYPQWDDIVKEIECCHQLQPSAAEPPGFLLVGQTHAGKSTLLRWYASRFPPVREGAGKRQPVVMVNIPTTGSISDLATVILDALEDPRADRGTTGNKTLRVRRYFKDVGVSLVIFDELQHFVDRDSARVLLNASNWLKDVIKQTRVACVLAGLEGDTEEVVRTNDQLAGMFPDPTHLEPFPCDELRQMPGDAFCTFLQQLESMLPLQKASHLSDEERAWRCYVASGGVIGYVMLLIRTAARLALDARKEYIDERFLAEAFAKRLGGKRRGIPNPFVGERPNLPPKKGASPPHTGNLNRRSRARGGSTDRMKQYF